MNSQHRAIRAVITSMSPRRATAYISAFELPAEEEACVLLHDVSGLSYTQISELCHASPETIKRRRQRAYSKIADELAHKETRG